MKKRFDTLVSQIGRVILGKEKQIRLALTCLFAQGHLLIEDLPGIGKTTLGKVLSRCLALLRAARSRACFWGRGQVIPEDVQMVFPWVCGHRLRSREDLMEFSLDRLTAMMMKVAVP